METVLMDGFCGEEGSIPGFPIDGGPGRGFAERVAKKEEAGTSFA
jgi:hypothetical protein